MKRFSTAAKTTVWVAIDVAKARHEVLIERPDGRRVRMSIANAMPDFQKLTAFLGPLSKPCEVALEPTGDYHRPLANFLL